MADYIIGDRIALPLEHATHYSEKIAHMPHCYLPAGRKRAIGERPTRQALGLPDGVFVFCSFNRTHKLAPQLFDVWCRLLTAVPRSVLWLSEPNSKAAIANLSAEARARGITPERLIFAPRTPTIEAHLGRLQQADLALDTFPYTSHATGADALWAGVPMVSCTGDTFASRVGASLLHGVNLPELVTRDFEEYYRLALELALEPDRLHAIRAKLRAERLSVPLFDTECFTRDLERLYIKLWENQAQGSAAHVTLDV